MSTNQAQKPNFVGLAVGAVSAIVAYVVVSGLVSGRFTTSDASVDAELTKTAAEINGKCPMTVDEFTRLDSTAALPGRKLMYKYTIVNKPATLDSEALVAALRPRSINNYKTVQEMATLRKMKVTLVYSYSDDKGNQFARFEI